MKCKHLISLLVVAFLALGCGGTTTSGGASTSGALFITDSLDSHDHVWVKVHTIVLTKASGSVTVFSDAEGKVVDLKTLRDPQGERYAFFGTVKSDTYSAVTFTLDKDVVLFANGSTTGEARVFQGHNGSTVDMSLAFGAHQTVSPTSPCAVDFDLTNWTDDGVTVSGSPWLKLGTRVGIENLDRHVRGNIYGSVRALAGTAPNQTFVLARGNTSVTVMTNSQTVLCGFGSLSDGMRVRVRGAFSTTANAFVATSIHADDGEGDEPEVEGSVTSINVIDGSFDIEVEEADNFTPMVGVIKCKTNDSTLFLNAQGQVVLRAQFFLALIFDDRLEVKGSYDAGANVMTAERVEFADEQMGE